MKHVTSKEERTRSFKREKICKANGIIIIMMIK